MSDTPSRLIKWIQYSPVTGVIEIVTSDFPDWITTYPDKGRQLRRDIHAGPVNIKETVFIEEGSLTQFPFRGRELRRNIHAIPVNEVILVDEDGHLTQIQRGRKLPRHIHTGATFVPDIAVVVVEEGSLVQLAERRKLRRDIHAGPSIPGLFIPEQLVWNPIYPDHVDRIRLLSSQQQFTTIDPNPELPVVVGQAVPGSRHRRRSRSRTIYRES